MNISNTINYSLAKIMGTKERVPLIAFAVAVLGMVYAVIYNLVFAIAGSVRIFVKLHTFFNVLSTIAFIVLTIYLVLLFVKKKNVLHLIAGIFLFLSIVLGTTLLTNLCWIVFAVCIAYPSFTGDDEELKNVVKLALLLVLVGVVMSLLATALWRLPRVILGLYFVISSAVKVGSYVLLLVLFLHEAETAGGVKEVVDSIIAKVKGGKNAEPAPQPQPEVVPCKAENEVPVKPAPEPVVPVTTEIRTEAAPVIPSAASGGYQYKTVAGPVGLTVNKNDNFGDGVSQYSSIIQSESVGGWELDSIHEIPVTKNNGCIAALMGRPTTTVVFNMLIFRKEL